MRCPRRRPVVVTLNLNVVAVPPGEDLGDPKVGKQFLNETSEGQSTRQVLDGSEYVTAKGS